jgi:GntR family transcriptional regulator, transcriptional repressor for pyruvate dehydrogenase complex
MVASHTHGQRKQSDPTVRAPSERRAEWVYRQILALITEQSLVEGDRLPSETEMATRYSVSRPVVREALNRLQQAGLVTIRWGAGSYVSRQTSPQAGLVEDDVSFGPVTGLIEVRQCYEARQAIEGDAAALAARRQPEQPLREARQALDRLAVAVDAAEVGREADHAFHLAIAAAAGNPFFPRLLRALHRPLDFSIGLSRTLSLTHLEQRVHIVHAEHVAVLEAIEAGDADGARSAMRAHLANAARRVFFGPGGSEEDITPF